MHKEGGAIAEKPHTIEFDLGALPCMPALAGDWMPPRAHRQDILNHQLTIFIPAVPQKATFRFPPHAEGLFPIQHPAPFDSIVDFRGETLDFAILLEVAAASENT